MGLDMYLTRESKTGVSYKKMQEYAVAYNLILNYEESLRVIEEKTLGKDETVDIAVVARLTTSRVGAFREESDQERADRLDAGDIELDKMYWTTGFMSYGAKDPYLPDYLEDGTKGRLTESDLIFRAIGFAEEFVKENKEEYDEAKEKYTEEQLAIGKLSIHSEEEEVGYWRKANHIHKWFVDNVQDGEDDCASYPVSKEQLEELLNACKRVVAVSNSSISEAEKNDIYDEVLPTRSGFFFGGTEYDEYYIIDAKNTIEIIEEIIEADDFDKSEYIYQSSW